MSRQVIMIGTRVLQNLRKVLEDIISTDDMLSPVYRNRHFAIRRAQDGLKELDKLGGVE